VTELPTESEPVRVVQGDALEVLRSLPVASVDAVITDPPYPCIKREYGYWTESEWFDLINPVVAECRRILKPTGSAVFVLQPNSERVGRMRTWLWEFMAKWGREWGVVQDAYWWKYDALPLGGCNTGGLLRPSLKPCVWLGPPNCYRNQGAVLWAESDRNAALRTNARMERKRYPSGRTVNDLIGRDAAIRRDGVTPFNVLPVPSADTGNGASAHGHSAGTPDVLCRWWTRYICPPGGTVVDPFVGSGTVALAALAEGRLCLGVERHPPYAEIARKRAREAMGTGLFALTGTG
jgi:DNA modification methylase